MPNLLSGVATSYLELKDYIADYQRVAEQLTAPIWKLELGQVFREPGNPSWEAYTDGRWEDALQHLQKSSEELSEYFAALRAQGSGFFRVRAVARPLSSYLQWEAHALNRRYLAGEQIRIVSTAAITALRSGHGEVPELVVLGQLTGYAVDYGTDGTPRGATKFDDPGAIARCRKLIEALYQRGEEFGAFFEREVLPLAPPIPP
jgi:hypothetical protein